MSATIDAVIMLEGQASGAEKEEARCFHCHEAITTQRLPIVFAGAPRSVCCVGCQAVANTIIDAGFGDYYLRRSAPAHTTTATDAALSPAVFDLPGIRETYLAAEPGNTEQVDLHLSGITCSACLWLAETALRRVPGVQHAEVNYITHRARLTWPQGEARLADAVNALRQVGLDAAPVSRSASGAARAISHRQSLRRMGIAGLSMMQVMMFTVPLYFTDPGDIADEARHLMQWASLVLTLPVLYLCGQTFFASALRALVHRQTSMDLPVALTIVATFCTSAAALITQQGETYFDAITMFVFLLLAARHLENRLRDQALDHIERMTHALPATAWRLSQYPESHAATEVPAALLQPGEFILIPGGQTVPADATLVDTDGEIDESLLTGESLPVWRKRGETVLGGSINSGAPLLARVDSVGSATHMARLARLTEQAWQGRTALTTRIDAVARWLSPAILALSALGAVLWLFVEPANSFNVAVAVLAISCPCALALAAPTVSAVATLRASRLGMLIAGAQTLAKLARVTDVVFDKTGTLTKGRMAIESVAACADISATDALTIANALEAGSVHPFAKALRDSAPDATSMTVTNRQFVPGAGVEGTLNGMRYRLGHAAFALTGQPNHPLPLNARFVLSANGKALANFQVSDALKPDAADCVTRLKAAGYRVHLLSGDHPHRVAECARQAGIDAPLASGGHAPQDKLDAVQRLRASGANVLMIGDGVNDAPVLAAADVSIALASGADLSRLHADAVLLGERLESVATLLALAKRAQRILYQNLLWAGLYNLIAIPLALCNLINPAWAALGMGASSLLVVTNALRLQRG